MARAFDFHVQGPTANAVVRPLNAKLAGLPFVQDFAGFVATDVAAALGAALTDGAYCIFPPGVYALDTDYTIAAAKHVWLMPGAVLTVNSGKTLTCTGTLLYQYAAQLVRTGTVSGAGDLLTTTTSP